MLRNFRDPVRSPGFGQGRIPIAKRSRVPLLNPVFAEEVLVANHPSAMKRMRQNEKRRARNRAVRSRVKTEIKKVLKAVEENNAEEANAALRSATSILGKSASKGVYHRNNASRKIARLARKVNALNQ
jgi:small subunit ribosomal protein S20